MPLICLSVAVFSAFIKAIDELFIIKWLDKWFGHYDIYIFFFLFGCEFSFSFFFCGLTLPTFEPRKKKRIYIFTLWLHPVWSSFPLQFTIYLWMRFRWKIGNRKIKIQLLIFLSEFFFLSSKHTHRVFGIFVYIYFIHSISQATKLPFCFLSSMF